MRSPMHGPNRLLAGGAVLIPLLFAGTALGQTARPQVGDTYYFNCRYGGGFQIQETYKVTAARQHMVRVSVETGQKKNWYEKPYYFLPTTLMTREKIGGKDRSMRRIPSDFDGLKAMKVGTSFKGWLNEKRSGKTLNWSYKIAVVGSDRFYTKKYGDLEVKVVDEQRFANLYSSTLISYYSPQLRFPVFWKYSDSNDSRIECRLDDAELAQALVASAPSKQDDAISRKSAAQQPAARVTMMTVANANVRAKPGVGAQKVAVLPAESKVTVLNNVKVGGELWYEVGLDGGKSGFVYGPLLSAGAPAQKLAALPKAAPAPAPAAPAQPAVKTRAIGPAAAKSVRIARLDEVFRSGLLTKQEYERKLAEIKGEKAVGTVAEQLSGINRRFRGGKLTPEEFIQARSKVLQTISPQSMDVKNGLVLLDQLIEKKLISQTEYGRKRQQMIDGI